MGWLRRNYKLLCRNAVLLLRLALGGLLIWTGVSKIQQPYDFLGAVYSYELVGPRMGFWIAAILPWLEVVVGLSLTLGVCQLGGAFLASLLFSVFLVAKALAVAGGLKLISCGCSASLQTEVAGTGTVVESGLLLLAAGLVYAASLAWSSPALCSRDSSATGSSQMEGNGPMPEANS